MAKRKITPQHHDEVLAYLSERGLDGDDAKHSCLYEVDAAKAKALGFSPALPGLVIPYYDPFNGEPLDVRRIRYFDPPLIEGKPRRYSQPAGTPVEAYFDPSVDWSHILNNPKVALHIVEGEIKAIAANKQDIVTIALGGVYSFGGDALTPMLQEVTWKGRSVFIVYDSDAANNPKVMRAEEKLAAILITKGAIVTIVRLPNLIPGGKCGLDDFLLRAGKQAFIGLRDASPPLSNGSVQSTEITWKPLGELMSQPVVEVDYLWEGRLAMGTTNILVSKPKVGKSTLARNLALAVSRGESFLGVNTQKGSVLYLALEERAEDVTADFRAMGAYGTEDILIADAGMMVSVVAAIRKRRPILVVIDPMIRLVRILDANAYAELYAVLGPLIDIARETGACVLILHHSSKTSKSDAIDSPLGSTAMAGAVSTLIIMKRFETHRTMQTVQRIGRDMPETVIHFDDRAKRLSLGGSREDTDVNETADRILAFMGEATCTEPEILRGVEGGNNRKVRAIRRLTAQGKLTRCGTGKRGDSYQYLVSRTLVQKVGKNQLVRETEGTFKRPMPIGEKGRTTTTPLLVSTRVRETLPTPSTSLSHSAKVVRTRSESRRVRVRPFAPSSKLPKYTRAGHMAGRSNLTPKEISQP